MAQRGQYWSDVAKEKASPLYEEAFQGGSMAPLESQLGDAFNASSRAVADARTELSTALRGQTLSEAGVSRAGDNVYANASALPDNRAAQSAVEGARQRLAQAEAGHAQTVETLRRAQGDAASNAPGAVWNPRLQQFIDDPLSKVGLSRGLEIQRIEALAEGKPFNPSEYAITGTDQAGNSIVGSVPNMRTLDAIKRGYDGILNDYPKDLRGNPIFDERGRAITMAKQSLVGELDNVNDDYSAARSAYGTFMQQKDALNAGYDAAPKGTYARDIQPKLAGENYPVGEYQSGYATNLRDQVSNAGDSSDPYKLIYGGNERRAKIGAVFPEGAPQFARQYGLEQDMAKTYNEALGGSQTAGRIQADQQLGGGGGAAALDGAGMMMGGGAPLGTILRMATQAVGDNWKLGLGVQRADEIAPALFNTNPLEATDYLDELIARQAVRAARQHTAGKIGGWSGAGVLTPLTIGAQN